MRAEFSIYPFQEGETPPGYVQAAIERLRGAGIDVEIGVLGQAVRGDMDHVVEALRIAIPEAIRAGATKVVATIEVAGESVD